MGPSVETFECVTSICERGDKHDLNILLLYNLLGIKGFSEEAREILSDGVMQFTKLILLEVFDIRINDTADSVVHSLQHELSILGFLPGKLQNETLDSHNLDTDIHKRNILVLVRAVLERHRNIVCIQKKFCTLYQTVLSLPTVHLNALAL